MLREDMLLLFFQGIKIRHETWPITDYAQFDTNDWELLADISKFLEGIQRYDSCWEVFGDLLPGEAQRVLVAGYRLCLAGNTGYIHIVDGVIIDQDGACALDRSPFKIRYGWRIV